MKERINVRKVIGTVIVFNILQVLIVVALAFYGIVTKRQWNSMLYIGEDNILLLVIIIVIFTSGVVTIKNMYSINFINNEQNTLKVTLQQLEELNMTLRSQRHDFINHLQVVYSLMEMTEYTEARDYIEKIYNDIQKVNRVLKTSNSAVNALLQAKLIFSEKKNINVKLNITSQLQGLIVPSWEFCRVLGNILDNSIYALDSVNSEKYLEVSLYEDLKNYWFKIINNGPRIPTDMLESIFRPGFTTKGEDGEGMGLSIAKGILTRYGGGISVTSDEKNTVFEGWIPKL